LTSAPPADDWEKHWEDYSSIAEVSPAQIYRRMLAIKLLGLDARGGRVVDIGSGQGDFVAELRRRFPTYEVLGLEYSQSGIDVSARKVPDATFLRRDLLQPPEPPVEYRDWGTHAVCVEVLEHVDQPETLLANASAFLAPGCRLVVTVPGGPMSQLDHHIGHRQHFTPATLRSLLTRAGLEVETATTAGFPFFNLYRIVVVMRGGKLVDDVSDTSVGTSSHLARALMHVFDMLFRLNVASSPWGWQIVAVARKPA
jgi:SAM-dependent methyltransferase